MSFEALRGAIKFSKEVLVGIICKIGTMASFTGFRKTLNAEMVVVFDGESTFACIAFQEPLGQRYACRNAIVPHLGLCYFGVFFHIKLHFPAFFSFCYRLST